MIIKIFSHLEINHSKKSLFSLIIPDKDAILIHKIVRLKLHRTKNSVLTMCDRNWPTDSYGSTVRTSRVSRVPTPRERERGQHQVGGSDPQVSLAENDDVSNSFLSNPTQPHQIDEFWTKRYEWDSLCQFLVLLIFLLI